MTRIVVVYHTGFGHTEAVANSILQGANTIQGIDAALINTDDLPDPGSDRKLGPEWDELHSADALIFGCPTYMGTVSAGFKRFMDASGTVWFEQRWRDKLAAGFTVASGLSGDKLNTLMAINVFAAQHSMVWVSQGIMGKGDINRMGSYLGMMAQAGNGPATETPPPEDHETARQFGERVAKATLRWAQTPQ
ncbi:MAG: flavodoxin family protein [Phycisphaerales bacterium]